MIIKNSNYWKQIYLEKMNLVANYYFLKEKIILLFHPLFQIQYFDFLHCFSPRRYLRILNIVNLFLLFLMLP